MEVAESIDLDYQYRRSIIYVETDLLSLNTQVLSKPVAVCWGQHVVGCNQVSRKLGVYEGMLVSMALEKCRGLLLFNTEQITQSSLVADGVTNILRTFSPVVERVTLDQSFIDVTNCSSEFSRMDVCDSQKNAQQLALDVQRTVMRELNVSVRVGVGHSKAAARICALLPDQETTSVHSIKIPRFLSEGESVVPCDRWRSVMVDTQIRERLRTLAVRLLALAQEDGRPPVAVKLTVRRVDATRCTSWKDTRTGPVPAKVRGARDAVTPLLEVAISLLHRLVDFHHSFHLTLLGLAFVRFEDCATKRSIASCILRKRELSVQMVVSISHEGGDPHVASRIPSHLSREPEEAGPCEKRAKLDIVIKKRKFREQMDLSSPSKLRVADLTINGDDGITAHS